MKFILPIAFAFAASAFAQDKGMSCPMHDEHMKKQAADRHAGVNERGDHAMGFSHEKTAHHFRLLKDGGAIEVQVNDASDSASRNEIRGHLTHIAQMFTDGNFEIPMFIHDQVAPGIVVMKDRKARIQYRFESTEQGARVRIVTKDKKALQAVHEFLRFQISDHQTGDTSTVSGF